MYLYGASGHAKVIVDILRAIIEPIEALFDDNEAIHRLLDYPVLRSVEVKGPLIISIGNNNIRKKIAEQVNVKFGKAFHPSAIISATTTIDEGTVDNARCYYTNGYLYRETLYYKYRCFC